MLLKICSLLFYPILVKSFIAEYVNQLIVKLTCFAADDVALPKNEGENFKDHEGGTSESSVNIPSSDSLEPKQDELKDSDSDDEDSSALTNQTQLNEEREVLPPDEPVPDSTMERTESWEIVGEESTESSSDTLMNVSHELSDQTGGFMYGLSFMVDWNYMDRFSKKWLSDDAGESSQQIGLPRTETTGGMSLDKNECADKSAVSDAEEDNGMSRSSSANQECDITASAENLSASTDVLPPSSGNISWASLEGSLDSNGIHIHCFIAEYRHAPIFIFCFISNTNAC